MQRRTLEEIRARYELEPDLRDIFVEGALDADIIRWFFDRAGSKDVVVYEIDTVDIPSDLIVQRGLASGMRGRIIVLAEMLAGYLLEDATQATCIADLDLDLLVGVHIEATHLIYTDYSCMEMYLFEAEVLNKFLHIVASGSPHTATELAGALSLVLREAAFLRAAKHLLEWDLPWLSVERFCEKEDMGIRFDNEEMIGRTLLAGGRSGSLRECNDIMAELRDRSPEDIRLFGNGHDLIELLTWYLRRFVGMQGVQSRFVHRALVACLEFSVLREHTLFAKLLQRSGLVVAAVEV